jgi:hypothetical protein
MNRAVRCPPFRVFPPKAGGKPALLSLLLLAWAIFTGCATPKQTAATGPIDELHLMAMPVALELDAEPGADSFAIKVYATNRALPRPLMITTGTVEVLMFDGVIQSGALTKTEPLRVWSFPAADLAQYAFKSSFGPGYQFQLGWGKDRPRQPRITVTARYLAPDRPVIYAAPSSIMVSSR